jgi:hypothetical protein
MYIIYLTEVVLDATCLDGEPATQCADGLAECRDESGFKCFWIARVVDIGGTDDHNCLHFLFIFICTVIKVCARLC